MTDETPQWAWDEVEKRVPTTSRSTLMEWAKYTDKLRGLAAGLIAKHEEKPIDPLLEEAREIVAKCHDKAGRYAAAVNTREGKWDHLLVVGMTVEGLRRGIELGKAGAA